MKVRQKKSNPTVKVSSNSPYSVAKNSHAPRTRLERDIEGQNNKCRLENNNELPIIYISDDDDCCEFIDLSADSPAPVFPSITSVSVLSDSDVPEDGTQPDSQTQGSNETLLAGSRTVDEVLVRCRKFHRFALCEWFYSDIDWALFAKGSDEKHEFAALVERYFPALKNRTLNRAEWNHIRRKLRQLGHGPMRRRCSPALFYAERVRLEQRRMMVRLVQSNPMMECLPDDLPPSIPPAITAGSKVQAQLNQPVYGIFIGTVVEVAHGNEHVFLVNFGDQFGGLGEQYIEDYRLALVKETQRKEAEVRALVAVPNMAYTQLLSLEEALAKKRSILDFMEKVRYEWRHANRAGEPSTSDRENAPHYLQAMKQLVSLDRAIIRQEASMRVLYNDITCEPPLMHPLESPPEFYDPIVVEAAEVLQAGHREWCESQNSSDPPPVSAAEELWKETVKRLNNDPVRMDELRRYIQRAVQSKLR